MKDKPVGTYILLYLPWILSLLFDIYPQVSYLIAWSGSFFIFYITLTGKLRSLPQDRKISEQLMRPIFLVQIVFCSYMCLTSIFYYLDVLGYRNFEKINTFYLVDQNKLMLTAQCQRYYCLGHAAFATGVLMFMQYPVIPRYNVKKEKVANLLFVVALVTFPLSTLFLVVPGLSQFYYQLSSL